MMNITLSGILIENCEKKKDKKGHEYIRFSVSCKDLESTQNPTYAIVRCFTYNTKYDSLKKGDYVFLTGSLRINNYNDKQNLDVYVSQLAMGDNI